MENEMIERVARAMHDLCQAQTPTQGATWENSYPEARDQLRQLARAAVEAMREPTEAMKEAGISRAVDLIEAFTSTDYVADETWAAVIDAALTPMPDTASESGL